jgi:factor associated with neutral sphingomyelinase activation
VFPHIIADFKSKTLNLADPASFRDLSKPIGALNPERLLQFKQRLHSMPPMDSINGVPPPFLFGTHYSTQG